MELPLIVTNICIGEIARYNPNSMAVFQKYGIDFYCKGKQLLGEACAACGCSESDVLSELENISSNLDPNQNFNDWSIDALIEYIIANHHQYVNKTVPEIVVLFKAVLADSSIKSADLIRVSEIFRLLGNDMKQHMQKEELALFPAMKKLESINLNEPTARSVSIQTLIPVVEMEHDTSGIMLKQISGLFERIINADCMSNDLTLLTSKMKEFESDLIMHIHVENNVLHKKAIELEQALMN